MKKKNIILTIILIIALVVLIKLSKITIKNIVSYNYSEKCLNSTIAFAENNT